MSVDDITTTTTTLTVASLRVFGLGGGFGAVGSPCPACAHSIDEHEVRGELWIIGHAAPIVGEVVCSEPRCRCTGRWEVPV